LKIPLDSHLLKLIQIKRMKIIEFIRLILKHLRLLIAAPLLLAGFVIILTLKPAFEYSSQTVLYTGLASGSSIEMDKKFNYQAANTAFDNLINIIVSRETQEEVAIRLLAQHLMLPKANPKYISAAFFNELKVKIPTALYDCVATGDHSAADSASINNSDSLLFPPGINRINYEETVKNLTALMKSSNTNFVYELLNYKHPHYSLEAISKVKAMRISNSDLIKLTYVVNDPGICQQTLAIYNKVCIKNYKNIKENRSDAVVKYFELQLANANNKLKSAEDKLLEFNKSYNIINYYEQSKAVAVVKEDMLVDYNNKKAQLAGSQAATKRLEEKLNIQEQVQTKSNSVLEKKKELGDLNFEIGIAEAELTNDEESLKRLTVLKNKSEILKKEIKSSIDELYTHQNSLDGLPINKLLPEWMDNVVESENIKAKLRVMDQDNKKFQEQYAIYAPAGANIKRIEREISVSEQGYLEILHGLNLAKLKLQDNTLSANLKTIDPPFYPLNPIPTKRKILVILAAIMGVILVFGIVLIMEYFDDTLKNIKKTAEILKLPALGMVPKILLNPNTGNFPFIQNRLVEIITQHIKQFFSIQNSKNPIKTMLFISTREMEGKSVLAGNVSKKLKEEGKKVLFLNNSILQKPIQQQGKRSFLNRFLGYPDPRIAINSSFLADPSDYLDASEYFQYKIDEKFDKVKTYNDIIEQNGIELDCIPEYVIIELPNLINNNYPAELIKGADLSVLVCRANRLWSEADQSVLDNILPFTGSKLNFIVNGVAIKEVEALMGDLPKKGSKFRKKIKNLLTFQFFSKNQL